MAVANKNNSFWSRKKGERNECEILVFRYLVHHLGPVDKRRSSRANSTASNADRKRARREARRTIGDDAPERTVQ